MMNDVIGFDKLYKKYHKDIMKFSLWLSGNPDDAKDIAAETFVRLWTAKNEIKTITVKGYLLTIARNIYLQSYRKNKRFVELNDDYVDPSPHMDKKFENQKDLIVLIKSMQKLTEIERVVIIMKTYEGLSYQEISTLLGISIQNLKVKVHRSRLKLQLIMSRGERNGYN